jgi:hypothetical protein
MFSKQARAETFRELRHLQLNRPMCTIERLHRGAMTPLSLMDLFLT